MFGRIPLRGNWVAPLHRWSGRIAVAFTVPVAVHCLYALGFQTFDARVAVHSILGCFFFGAFICKMLILTRDDSPGWALPVLGGVVFSGLDRTLDDCCTLVFLWAVHDLQPRADNDKEPTMNPYVRPADSLPVSRRSMIMNAGLAAAALAGLSSCTNYGADQAPTGGGSCGPAPAARRSPPRPPTSRSAGARSS